MCATCLIISTAFSEAFSSPYSVEGNPFMKELCIVETGPNRPPAISNLMGPVILPRAFFFLWCWDMQMGKISAILTSLVWIILWLVKLLSSCLHQLKEEFDLHDVPTSADLGEEKMLIGGQEQSICLPVGFVFPLSLFPAFTRGRKSHEWRSAVSPLRSWCALGLLGCLVGAFTQQSPKVG